MKKALIAMSGGVDSSVAAALTLKAGYQCVGATMRLHKKSGACGSADDLSDAKAVAEKLGIEHHTLDFSDAFEEKVVRRFVSCYEKGQTPNPCIDCNRYMKFGKLYAEADKLGCDAVVTGHYARIVFDGSRYLLKKAKDEQKDQSYVLYFLTQNELAKTMLPLGELDGKEQVRRLAKDGDLINADKPDSQDICFVPDGDYAGFIRQFTGKEYPEGDFVDSDGNILGRHKGIIHYTIGQRKGLGLALKAPGYVCQKDIKNNRVVVDTKEHLLTDRILVTDVNWIAFDTPPKDIRCTVKTRYQAPEAPASAFVQPDGTVQIVFDTPQKRAASGQSIVFYDGDTVLGGGIAALLYSSDLPGTKGIAAESDIPPMISAYVQKNGKKGQKELKENLPAPPAFAAAVTTLVDGIKPKSAGIFSKLFSKK